MEQLPSMSTGTTSQVATKRVYFENLDGLRFLCFLSVFFFHSFHTDFDSIRATDTYHFIKRDIFGNGNLGVNFFFVLSGFLITYLLIEEKNLNGQIDIKRFWLRRILRIWCISPLIDWTEI
jgi:peptidoglycan/LPS O-acetylase OafA/YrhL